MSQLRWRKKETRGPGDMLTMHIQRWQPAYPQYVYDVGKVYGFNNSQVIMYDRRYCLDYLNPGPPFKSGGPLHLNAATYPFSISDMVNTGTWGPTLAPNGWVYRATGGFCCGLMPATISGATLNIGTTQSGLVGDDTVSYGATAWNRFRPGKPKHSLGQALAEAKDLPKMLFGSAKHFADVWRFMGGKARLRDTPKQVADEFLNTQFGWTPFLSDLRSLRQLVSGAAEDVNRLKAQNNKWIRRSGVLSDDVSSSVLLQSSTNSAHNPSRLYPWTPSTGNTGSYTVTSVTSKKIWFTARFKYYIPELNAPDWKQYAIRHMYGLRITPTLLYQLTPWTWLIDWFSNAGDIVANMDAALNDGLVAKYAYIMSKTERDTVVSSFMSGLGISHNWRYSSSYKHRTAADPYSFGFESSTLSTWQSAILAALGISRLR